MQTHKPSQRFDATTIEIEEEFTRDVSRLGHFVAGNFETASMPFLLR
jgi:predicted transport protein